MASGTIRSNLESVNAGLYERDHCNTLLTRSNAPKSRVARLISQAQVPGYQVALYVVSEDDPKRLQARFNQRVEEGCHHVLADRILQRYPRTMEPRDRRAAC